MFGQNKGTGFTGFSSLGSTGTTASTGFTFGSTTSTAGSSGFTFGTSLSQPLSTGTTASTGPGTSGFTFGSTSSQPTAFGTPAASTSSSGATGVSFGLAAQPSTQATTTSTAAKPATQFGFGFQTSQPSATSSVAAAPALSLGSLGSNTGAKTGTTGFSFGAAALQSAPSAASGQPASTSGTLGLKPLTTPLAAASTEGQKAATATGFTFGQTAAASTKPSQPISLIGATSQPAATTTSIGFGGFGAKTTAATTTTATVQPTSSTASASTEKTFTYKQLEDIINKWVQELEEQETIFLNQAKQVNAWDRILIENGEKITIINDDIQRLKTDQSRLDRELDFILSQQQELEEILIPLEEQVKAQQSIPYMQHADLEREKTYKMAENIDTQLKRMMQDIKDIISHINTSNVNIKDNDDPMSQIAKILNSHMDSLQWVDQNAALLQRKVEDVNKQVESRRREHERSLRLTFAD